MSVIETDYLVVGAGATGMAFTDSLIAASAAELCDYYRRVLDEHLIPSGQVRFLGMHDHLGKVSGEHHLASLVTGETTTVRVRRKLVDATYMESSLPSTHTLSFGVDPGARLVTPNQLVSLGAPASAFTVIGAGKTAMDTCCWLIDNGVAPDAIRWIRPRDAWTNDRAAIQPLSLVSAFAQWLASTNEASAEAHDLRDLLRRLEDSGVFVRLDPHIEPGFFRGAILSEAERSDLRSIENVVRLGRVVHIGADRVDLEEGSIPGGAAHVYVDCTAAGLAASPNRPVFEDDLVTVQWVQAGIAPFSAAVIGFVEATRDTDDDKNRLCPPNGFTPEADARNFARGWATTQRAIAAWMAEPDLNEWLTHCRLSPLGNAAEYLSDPAAMEPLMRMLQLQDAAIDNLERILAAPDAGSHA